MAQNLFKPCLALALGVTFAASTALAIPYASGVKRTGDTVTFILNQNAISVEVLRDGGNPVYPGTEAGLHSFSMAGFTKYEIRVTGNETPGWKQYIPDGTNTSFYVPLGVSVNKNPPSPHFGKVFISEAQGGAVAVGYRTTTSGIYMLHADGSDAGWASGGVDWAAAGNSAPFKNTIGPDDHLYVADLSRDLAFEFNDDLSVATQLMDESNRGVGQYVHSIYVEGTQAGGDRRIYLVNGNYNDTAGRGLIRYDLGAEPMATAYDTGTPILTPVYYSLYYPMDIARDSNGDFYVNQYRSTAGQAFVITKFDGSGEVPLDDDVIWEASDQYTGAYGIDINELTGRVAYGDYYTGQVFMFDMATGEFVESFDAGNRIRDLAFDAAGNLVTVDNSIEWARFWSPGGYTVATTSFDGAKSSFQVTATSSPMLISVTPAIGATEVGLSAPLVFVFDEPMQVTTPILLSVPGIFVGNLELSTAAVPSVEGVWSADGLTLTCKASSAWPATTSITWKLNPDGTSLPIRNDTGVPCVGLSGSFSTSAPDPVAAIFLYKAAWYEQTTAEGPVLFPAADDPYDITASVYLSDELLSDPDWKSRITGMTLSTPSGRIEGLVPDYDTGSYEFYEGATSQEALNGRYGPGDYRFTLTSLIGGESQYDVPLAADDYPPPPHCTNFEAAQRVDPTRDFTLRWAAFTGEGEREIWLHVTDPITDEFVFSAGPLAGAQTAIDIPAGALAAARAYTAWLTFTRYTHISYDTVPETYSGFDAYNTFQLETLAGANHAPVLAAIPDRTIQEGSVLSATAVATDADGPSNILTFTLLTGPVGSAIDGETGVITWPTTETHGPGTYTFAVQVTDNGEPPLSDEKTFTVNVNEVNAAPVLAPIPDQTIPEGLILSVTVAATDADIPANVLTYSLVVSPAGATIHSQTGVITWATTEIDGPGTHTFSVQVFDNGEPARSDQQSFRVFVQEVNTPPTLTAVGVLSVDELQPLTLTVSATDLDLPANVLTYSLTGAPQGMTIESGGRIRWTPTEEQGPGTYSVTVLVEDDGLHPLSDSNTFSVTVNEANAAPVLAAIPDQTIAEGSVASVTAVATDPDVPADALTYSLLGAPAAATIDPATGVIAWTTTESDGLGTYAFTVQVFDNGQPPLNVTNTFNIMVSEVNSAPTLTAIPDQTIREGHPLALELSGIDDDLPTNVLKYALLEGPVGSTVNESTGALNWLPGEQDGGTSRQVTVSVTDNGEPTLSAERTFQVIVEEVNDQPLLEAIADIARDELVAVTLTPTAADVDLPKQNLVFSLVGAPEGAQVDPTTGAFTWTPSEAQGPGSYAIKLVVTDDGEPPLNDTKTFTVNVNEVNAAPVLAAIPDSTIPEEAVLLATTVTTDADVPANTLTYSLVGAPAGAAIDPTTGVITWATTESDGGSTYNLSVQVFDNGDPARGDQKSFHVTVQEINTPPILGALGTWTVDEHQTLAFTANASDTDLPRHKLSFCLEDAPDGATIESATGAFAWTPSETQGPGLYRIQVVVADDGEPPLTVARTVTVEVNEVNSPPSLATIADQFASVGLLLSVPLGAADDDLPANQLTVELVQAPPGANIDAGARLFKWTPGIDDVGVHSVTVKVTDDGEPSLDASRTFSITVERNFAISVELSGAELYVRFPTLPGWAYRVEAATDAAAPVWQTLVSQIPGTGSVRSVVIPISLDPTRWYYRVVELP